VIRRTLAVTRFLATDPVLVQRVLVPLVVFGAVLAVLFLGDPGPPPLPWAASALVSCGAAAWIAVLVANAEPPVHRVRTVAAAGGPARVVVGGLLLALVLDVVLAVAAVAVPVLATRYPHPPAILLTGVAVHLAATGTGTAVGLLCARPLVARTGWSFLLAALVVVVLAVRQAVPQVGTAVRALSAGGAAPVGEAVAGVLLAVLAAGVVVAVDRRR
jgi:hypothetical protein